MNEIKFVVLNSTITKLTRTSTLADLKLDAVVPIPDKVAKVTVFPPPTVTLEDARLTRDPVNPVESPIVCRRSKKQHHRFDPLNRTMYDVIVV